MPAGFFASSQLAQSKAPPLAVAACGACGLYKSCHSPKMPWTGGGRRKILIVAEAPGAEEDKTGRQLVGAAGQHLRKALERVGVDLEDDCWKTNAVICRPPNNATPEAQKIHYCRPNLDATLRELQPEIIIPLGAVAVAGLIGGHWGNDIGAIGRWVGWQIPSQRLNAWICPTWHPSYIMRCEEGKPRNAVPAIWWGRHLAAAVALQGRPWAAAPNYGANVRAVADIALAARLVRQIVARGGACAFDYETNMLKPEGKAARIVSCSICWRGKKTIAYPWHGDAITATQEFLRSPLPKIAANLKFEERWTIKEFGHGARNWVWDTMQAAHVLDNRRGITGLEFQAFIRLGEEKYSDHITPYLKANDESGANRILEEIELSDLLKYNGMDSLLEYNIAAQQMDEIGEAMPCH